VVAATAALHLRRLRQVRGARLLGLRGSRDAMSFLRQQLSDRARRLGDPLLVLDEREAHVAVAAVTESDPRADRDLGLARQAQGELEGTESAEGLGDRSPDEHRPARRLDLPAGAGEAADQRVAPLPVDV